MALVEHLINMSPLKLWDLLYHPWKIPFFLRSTPILPPVAGVELLLPEIDRSQAEAYRLQFLGNHQFFNELECKNLEYRQRRIIWHPWHEFLYMVVRIRRPAVVIETGVFDGRSSAIILQALEDNLSGCLISIDQPARDTIPGSTHRMAETTIPNGCTPGWLIPERLRSRHQLHLGDSKVLLPGILIERQPIGIFLHDSLHTFAHRMFEYQAAWKSLEEGGLLLSDDILWSRAFYSFCRKNRRPFVMVAGSDFGGMRR